MFYAHFVLAKKGPLAKIWLAAHWDKKLTKAHVFETNIEKSVDGILKPKVKMALRTSGHLLLGVVRIYSRKAKYLLQDCNEAFVKIKMAFRPGMVDLPEEHREAAMNAITLPEVFHDFDTAMPELNEVDIEAQFSLNQSRAEEITMREDYGSLALVTHDDGFGDMGFDTEHPDIMREAIVTEGGLEQSNLLFADGSSLELGAGVAGKPGPELATEPMHARRMEPAPHHIEDGFGAAIGEVADFPHAGGLFEGDLFGEVSAPSGAEAAGLPGAPAQPVSLQAEIDAAGVSGEEPVGGEVAPRAPDSDDEMGDHYDAGVSPQRSWEGSPAPEGAREPDAELMPPPAAPPTPHVPMEVDQIGTEEVPEAAAEGAVVGAGAAPEAVPGEPAAEDETTLLQNEEESFALAPVDATVLRGITKTKRKRKLIVDEVKNISGEEMKNQLSNTSDIVTTLDLAPPTRRLMHWKETGGVEKLFTLPARPIPSRVLFKKYQRNMTLRSEAEEGERASPEPEPSAPRRGARKRRHEETIQPPETPAPVPTAELEPPTPVPQEYEPSVEGMLSPLGPPLTPGVLGALTPGALLQGEMTPGGLPHGAITPGLIPELGLETGMTPAGLVHGGLTPSGLPHGEMTPVHGALLQGAMEPLPMMPQLGAEQLLRPSLPAEVTPAAPPHRDSHDLHTVPMEPLQSPLDEHTDYQTAMRYTGLGFEEQQAPHSPPHDYDLPLTPEHGEEGEREAGETDEQFEERVLNRRAAQLFSVMKPKLAAGLQLEFSDLAPRHNNRKQVAQKFYSLLVLKKHQVLKLEQHETYGPITISKGSQFETEAI